MPAARSRAGRSRYIAVPEIPTEKHAFLYVNLDAGKYVSCDSHGQAIPARVTPAVSPTPMRAQITQSGKPSVEMLAEIRSSVLRGAYPAAIGADVGTDADTVCRILASHFTGTDEEERWLNFHAPGIPRGKVSGGARSIEPSTAREVVTLPRDKFDKIMQKTRDEAKREALREAKATQKLLAAQAEDKPKRRTAKQGNNQTNAPASNARPAPREEEKARSSLAILDGMMRLAYRPMQTRISPGPANGQAVQPSSPALPAAVSPLSGMEHYPVDAMGSPLPMTAQIEQTRSLPSPQPSLWQRLLGGRKTEERPVWPYPEIHPGSEMGKTLRAAEHIPGWPPD